MSKRETLDSGVDNSGGDSGSSDGNPVVAALRYFDPGTPGFIGRMLRLLRLGCLVVAFFLCVGSVVVWRAKEPRWFVGHMLAQAEWDRVAMPVVGGLARDHPDEWRFHRMHALLLRRNDRIDEHLEVYDRAVEALPELWWPHSHRCFYRLLYVGADDVLADCDRSLELEPDWASLAYERRGVARAVLGDLDGSRADFEAALAAGEPPRYDSPRRQRELDRMRGWLRALEDGEQPIDDAELARLRSRYR